MRSHFIVGLAPISDNNISHFNTKDDITDAEKLASIEYMKHYLKTEVKLEEIINTKRGKRILFMYNLLLKTKPLKCLGGEELLRVKILKLK